MSFKLIHFIDNFIETVAKDANLSIANLEEYFGKQLSNTLLKKLKNIKTTSEVFNLNSRSLDLQTILPKKEIIKLKPFFLETLNLIQKKNVECIQLVDFNISHLSWIFFGNSNSTLLSKLYKQMYYFTTIKSKSLDFCINTNLKFNNTDYFIYLKSEESKSQKKNSLNESNKGLLFLKADLETIKASNKIFEELTKMLNINDIHNFIPHISIARIKNINQYNELLKNDVEKIWKNCEICFSPESFTLFRNIGKYKNMPVFGILKNTN